MSKTTERLVAVTNELEDIVAHFEEKERPDAGWINEHWVECLKNIRADGMMIWDFQDDDNPTTILHEVYMAFKDTQEANDTLLERMEHLRQRQEPVVNTHLQEDELRNIIRQADQPQFVGRPIDWANLRVTDPLQEWELPVEEIRGPDVA